MKFQEIGQPLDEVFPPEFAESWDNIRWMVRPSNSEVSGILVTVDVTEDVLDYAGDTGCNLIVSHHPLLFESLDQVREDRPVDRCVMKAIRNNLGIYTAHTNADSMPGGLNDQFAEGIGLTHTVPIDPSPEEETAGLGRIGKLLEPMTVAEVCGRVRSQFDLDFLRAVGEPSEPVETIGICTGSGGDFITPELAAEIDLYISADLGHHDVLEALGLELPLINLDHYEMETVFLPLARNLISKACDFEYSSEEYRRENPYWDQ